MQWSHYKELIHIKNDDEIKYYINIALNNNLSVRELRARIKNNDYKRLDDKTKLKLIKNDKGERVEDFIKDPILIRNKYNTNDISEKVLQQLMLEDIESFMNELGNNYSFVGSEYKIKIGNRYNYIDLLLYNIDFNCYIVVELKVTELKKEHIGQIEIYMNYIDDNLKKITQDKTVGIIICKKDNKFIMEYCSDERILSRKYKLIDKIC